MEEVKGELKKDSELKVKSFRANDETFEKFKKIAVEDFGNQGQCLDALVNLYEVETSKIAMVERKLEIESFQDYLNKINNLFLTSLQLNQDAEARIRDEFARQLNSKDNMLHNLQEKNTEYREELKKSDIRIKEAENKCKELLDLNEILTKDKSNLEALIHKNDEILAKNKEEIVTMVEMVNEYKRYKEIYDEQIVEMDAIRQLSEELLRDIKSKELEITRINKHSKELELHIEELKLELKEEKDNIRIIRDEHKKELKDLEEKLEKRLSKEIESLNSMQNERLEIEKKSLDITIRTLENERKELELENIERINRLENEKKELELQVKNLRKKLAVEK